MDNDIRDYAKLGLVHHLLYAESLADPDEHTRTLEQFAGRDDIETFDCCLPYGNARRRRLVDAIRTCGKTDIAYATHLFPLRKISLGSTDPGEQGLIRLVLADQVEAAAAIGAAGMVFGSGADVTERERPAARATFARLLRWLCGRLKPHGITAMLEPFDRRVDKKFLYGPSSECVELVESLQPELDNLGLELDAAHVPLMGETFEHAIRTCAPHLKRVHLGNCIYGDPAHPLYGDKHPPIGIEGGEIDVPELAPILRLLLEVGYLNVEKRGALVLEIRPFPDRTADETVRDNMERLRQAWDLI